MWEKLYHSATGVAQNIRENIPKVYQNSDKNSNPQSLPELRSELGSEQFYSDNEEYKSVTAGPGSILNLITHSGTLFKDEISNGPN